MAFQKHLFLEQAEGYAESLGKSIFLALDLREVFELWPDKYYASGKRLKSRAEGSVIYTKW